MVGSYDRDNASPDELKVLRLFRGQTLRDIDAAAAKAKARALDAQIADAEGKLAALKKLRSEL